MSKTAEDRIAEAIAYIGYFPNAHLNSFDVDHLRRILTPPPKRHTFGGVPFEETGEFRKAQAGEWWLDSRGRPVLQFDYPTAYEYRILRYIGPK